jgi:primosomal protein N' (replication factor Y)
MWLDILGGRYRVVVGTRPAVFAPVENLGVVVVAREHHALHREERAPYFHVRSVADERARIEGAVCVLASVMPSMEAQAMPAERVEPKGRRWPPVEVVKPGPEGRAPRLVRALGEARRAFLYEPLRGYGVARVCRVCGPAACAACGGDALEARRLRCTVCEAPARCRPRLLDFDRTGRGRASRVGARHREVLVTHLGPNDRPRAPSEAESWSGIDAVKDLGIAGLDLWGS